MKKGQKRNNQLTKNYTNSYILEKQLIQLQSMIVSTRSLFVSSQEIIAIGKERLKNTNERLEVLQLQIQRSKKMLADMNKYFKRRGK